MITADHERSRAGAGAQFADAVAFDFSDPKHGLFGAIWMTRLPNAGRARSSIVLFADGELVTDQEQAAETDIQDWSDARLDGVRMQTAQPLEQWKIETQGKQGALRLDVDALSLPRELPGVLSADIGIDQYEQICRLSGTIDAGGQTFGVHCLGRRVHWWGEFPWNRINRWRTVYAVSAGGRAISAVAALPNGSDGHDAELRTAQFLDDPDALPFEDVRLSTVYGEDGLPAKVGLELWASDDDEFPRRYGGEAVCGVRAERGGHELTMTFFQWSIDGEPAYGCYEVVSRA
jgi:hypothetical protein